MAGFCTGCGATLADGVRFCNVCGTPVPVAEAVPVAPAAPVTPIAPVAEVVTPVTEPVAPVAPATPVMEVVTPQPSVEVQPQMFNNVSQGQTSYNNIPIMSVTSSSGRTPDPELSAITSYSPKNSIYDKPEVPAENKPVNMWAYFGLELALSVPIVGFVLTFVLAFAPKNVNIKNFVRSRFCFWIIGAVGVAIFLILTLGVGMSFAGLDFDRLF